MDKITNINFSSVLDFTQWDRDMWNLALGLFIMTTAVLLHILIRFRMPKKATPVKVFVTRIVKQFIWLGVSLVVISFWQSQQLQLLGSPAWFFAWIVTFAIVVGYDLWYTFVQLPGYVARYKERDLKEKFLPKKRKGR